MRLNRSVTFPKLILNTKYASSVAIQTVCSDTSPLWNTMAMGAFDSNNETHKKWCEYFYFLSSNENYYIAFSDDRNYGNNLLYFSWLKMKIKVLLVLSEFRCGMYLTVVLVKHVLTFNYDMSVDSWALKICIKLKLIRKSRNFEYYYYSNYYLKQFSSNNELISSKR